jgi:hypothetical protein
MTPYFGSELDLAHAEILTIQNIDRKLIKPEAALFGRKWFDYRQLHPAQATYLMVHHFNRFYGEFVGKALNRDRRFIQAFKGKDFMLTRERLSFWRLRQKIDELGMRYDFFLRFAMDWYIARGWGKQAPNPPRPAHVSTNDELIVDASNAWVRECRAKIQYAASPRFHVTNWCAAVDQCAYEAFLIEQIKQRPHPHFSLASALYSVGHLRIEAAVEHFEAQQLADAIDFCQSQISHR